MQRRDETLQPETRSRWWRAIRVFAAVVLLQAVAGEGRVAPARADSWTAVASLGTARFSHVATLLDDGRVLVAAGYGGGVGALDGAEIYDPIADTWTPTGSLSVARYGATLTKLADGRVMVSGGFNGGPLASVEIYDPTTATWSSVAPMSNPRWLHQATLLNDGRVLVTGSHVSASAAEAEIYDPAANTWTAAAPMATARGRHSATLLADGRVLVAGGSNADVNLNAAEIYDPATDAWSGAGTMTSVRSGHSATPLADGTIFVVGGFGGGLPRSTSERYDPATNTWTAAALAWSSYADHAAIPLGNGKIFIGGGSAANNGAQLAIDLYDPVTDTWSPGAPQLANTVAATMTLLPSGFVLKAGGTLSNPTSAAQVYDPTGFEPTPTATATATPTAAEPECPVSPDACTVAPMAKLDLSRKRSPGRSSFRWQWSAGTIALAELGNPLADTSYGLCLYENGGLVLSAAVDPAGNCGGKPCWKALSRGKGFAYKNRAGNEDGIGAIQLKVGDGKAKIQIKGKGAAVDASLATVLPLGGAAEMAVLLIKDSSAGPECWASVHPAPAKKNDGNRYLSTIRP